LERGVEEFIRCSFGIYRRKQGDVSSGNESTNALKWKGVITEISTRFSPDPLGFVNDGQLRWTAADLATYQSLPFLGMPASLQEKKMVSHVSTFS
jgi:hypothetical protein